jgi:biotin-(acetyl-CoA carboxylase) ligase
MSKELESLFKEIQQVVGNYYEVSLKDNEDTLNYVKSRPFIENIMSLCERNRNMEKRLKELEPLLHQYLDDRTASINAAVTEYIKDFNQNITKEQAAKILSTMTIQEIVGLLS